MYARIALGNVRRSVRDYAVYFVTLLFGVTVFYAFNSIKSQSVLLDVTNNAMGRMLDATTYFIGGFSVVVAAVLAFLVVYANRFIIKRRKREFGTYLVLGMNSSKVVCILFYEMLLVGAVSLVLGIALGAVLSQALAFATAALIGSTISHYQFVFSTQAMFMTLGCFAAMFVITLVMNVVYVSRRKLGDLLTCRDDVKLGCKIPFGVRLVVFIAAIALIGFAYYGLWLNKFKMLDGFFALITGMLVVGTFLLFWSASTMVMFLARRSKRFYLKGLRPFTLRQVSSRLTTTFSSMAMVSLLLFFALTTTSVGFGVMKIFVGDVGETSKYDLSLSYRIGYDSSSHKRMVEGRERYVNECNSDMETFLRTSDYGEMWNRLIDRCAQIDVYTVTGLSWEAVCGNNGLADVYRTRKLGNTNVAVRVMGVSQFNETATLTGETPVVVPEGQFVINNDVAAAEGIAQAMREKGGEVQIAGQMLTASPEQVGREIRNGSIRSEVLLLIVPDEVIDTLRDQDVYVQSVFNVMYSMDRAEGDALLQKDESSLGFSGYFSYADACTGLEMFSQAGGLKLLCTYLALYVGFILLVCTAAVLAIQQLSDVSDSLGSYRKVSVLGAEDGMVLKSLRAQVLASFLAPLPVAICYSAYAVFVLHINLFAPLGVNPLGGIFVAAAMLLVVYGCYLLVTFMLSRALVKDSIV